MADRKQFEHVPAPDPELVRLLKEKNRPVDEEEMREQRISFAFGNAPAKADKSITKDSVRHASLHIKLKA